MGGRPGVWTPLWAIVVVQAACTLFFVWDIAASVLGLRRAPLAWELRELLEIGAALGLILGVLMGALYLRSVIRSNRAMTDRLRRASGAFAEFLEERFAEWGLTPSERDVAWFTIKGLSIAEIARMRGTSEGTIKAQSNAIYRKAGVSGRTQLLSLFLEDLMEPAPEPPIATAVQ
jgi:DNA-binding CsgD family transcriptional regulator